MPLFACSKCSCIENTALAGGGYWWELKEARDKNREPKPLCSECKTGKWHGQFDKDPSTGYMLADDGFIYSKDEVQQEKKRFKQQKIKIVKELP